MSRTTTLLGIRITSYNVCYTKLLRLGFGDEFGASVATIGDLNEDGIVDIAVGAPYTDNVFADSGAVWILFLGKDGTVMDQQRNNFV